MAARHPNTQMRRRKRACQRCGAERPNLTVSFCAGCGAKLRRITTRRVAISAELIPAVAVVERISRTASTVKLGRPS